MAPTKYRKDKKETLKERIARKRRKYEGWITEYLRYSSLTGHLYWKKNISNLKAGDIAGWVHEDGYIRLIIQRKASFMGHHLAWFLHYGEWPEFELDHKDRNRSNNAIRNLRRSNAKFNMQNRGVNKNNKSGFTGVLWRKASEKWIASISVNNKRHHLGSFDTKEEAASAYKKAKKKFHKFNPKVVTTHSSYEDNWKERKKLKRAA